MGRNKIFIAVAITSVVLLAILTYFITVGREKADEKTYGIGGTDVKGVAVRILSEKTFLPTLSADDRDIIYLAGTEQALQKRSLKTGAITKTYPIDVPFVENIVWSAKKSKALLETLNESTGLRQFYAYDLTTETLAPLESGVTTAIFSKERILYKKSASDDIVLADWNGENGQKIATVKSGCDRLIGYSSAEKRLLCQVVASDIRSDLVMIDINNGKESVLIKDDFLWGLASPNKNQVVIGAAGKDAQDELSLIDFTGKKKELSSSTGQTKIAWSPSGEYLVAAVRKEGGSTDKLYLINTASGKEKLISQRSQAQISAENLLLSSKDNILYFTSNDYFYRLAIPE